MTLPINLAVIGALLILAVLVKLAEVSVGAASDSDLAPLIQKGSKSAKRVTKLAKDQLPFASSLKTAISVIEFFAAFICALTFVDRLAAPMVSVGMPPVLAMFVATTAVTLAYITFTVVVVAIIARHIAIKHSLKISLALSGFASVVSKLFFPLSLLLSAISSGILTLMGINQKEQESDVSEEAIKSLVDAGSEMGTIDSDEKEFIENVFAFDDLEADEVATHRTGITLLWTDESQDEWEKTVFSSHHTYFPICEDKIDNVIESLNKIRYYKRGRKLQEL